MMILNQQYIRRTLEIHHEYTYIRHTTFIDCLTKVYVMEYVSYIRTSTRTQNNGLEAQQNVIDNYIGSYGGEVVATYVEQVSGAKNERVELNKALTHCKRTGATLLVAKLDRVSRRVSFIASLMESNVNLKVCELPNSDAFQLHIYAALAEQERKLISKRTKQALEVLKSKGVQLGSPLNEGRAIAAKDFAATIKPHVEQLKKSGITSWNAMAKALNDMGICSARGGAWSQKTLQRCMGYVDAV